MGLRDALSITLRQPELHGCTPYAVQLCNSREPQATDRATATQPGRAAPSVAPATEGATGVQLEGFEPVAQGATQAPGDATTLQARLVHWGWSQADAEATADALMQMQPDDERRVCVNCLYYRPHRCADYRRARLHVAEVGRDLATTPQRCPAFRAVQE